MFSNIFAIIGALIGLLILDLPLSIYAQLGIVLLIGLASKNAILIVEFTLDYRKKGYDILKSALTGAGERFRAVLMTAFTFILGVFPMVIAKGAGAASQVSMGTSVFFGMIFATSIGVVFIPVLFAFFDKIIDKFSNKKNEVIKNEI
jgi:HAE1 family hydrophobic/amphiphilic exporter-1/multidrug efflux pump